jgi:2-keto-4-pentenoate hydratase/2-oxohepta-3-ene-1,7-dioic acid hydratase in catechol pathway
MQSRLSMAMRTLQERRSVDLRCLWSISYHVGCIIGRDCKDLTLQNAMDHVLGYTVANDVTARKFQARGSQWGFSKGFDTFCPLGPVVVSRQSLPDPKVLELKTVLNGNVMQNGEARNMIFSIEDILVYLSNVSSTQRHVEVTLVDLLYRDTL